MTERSVRAVRNRQFVTGYPGGAFVRAWGGHGVGMKKTSLLIGVAIGYVLGSRAGRERYEQIKSGAGKVAHSPKVQDAVGKAQDLVGQQASAVAGAAREKVGSHT